MDSKDFALNCGGALEAIHGELMGLRNVPLASLEPDKAVLIVVDMINGFAKSGALYSPRVEALIPVVEGLSRACTERGIPQLAFMDSHPENSPEFLSYPPHCLAGTYESQLVEELQKTDAFMLIQKNSTNGFLEPEFHQWLEDHPQTDTFIVVGDCTDICIQQFSVALKCSFNRTNRPSRVIVPINGVDTFDYGVHNGDLMHAVALMMMLGSGVDVVRGIDYE